MNPLPALDAGTVLGFGFGQPLVLVALLIPVLLVLAVRHARGRRARGRALLGGPPGLRDGADERVRLALAALVVLAALLAVVAGARPQWGEGDREIAQRGIDVVVALDVSRSMAAEDVTPSRARAASDGLEEMLTHLTGNRVGLVTFAGSAFERSPLTVDLGVLSSLIARSQSEAPLVRPGTNLAGAIEAGLHVLNVDDAAGAQAILLVSDGEDLDPAFERAVALARDRGVRIYTVFAGTANPTALPSTSGGNDVSTAQPEVLAAIAEATGGTVRAVDRIPGFAVDFRRLQQTQFDSATERQPIERFTWFAGAALALLLVAMVAGERGRGRLPRLRGGAITALVAAAVLAGCGTAAWRHAETGNEAYQAGAYEDALAAYRQAADAAPDDPALDYNIANALYQLRRYEEAGVAAAGAVLAAIEDDDAALVTLAHYTLGNTAFRRQEFEAARDSYVAALRIDPTDLDAKANLELVLATLEPPDEEEPAGDTGDAGEGDEGDEPGDEGDPGEQPGEGEPGEGAQPGETPPPGDSSGGAPGSGATLPEGADLQEVQTALAEALGELGPEITREQALRILELARRANELEPLPTDAGGGVPPR